MHRQRIKKLILSISAGIVLTSWGVFAASVSWGLGTIGSTWEKGELTIDLAISRWLMHTLDSKRAKQNQWLDRVYDVHFPENPFSDIVQEIENADIDIALGGIQMIQDQLALQQCFLSNDDITAILYYFNNDFRSNMALQVSRNTFHAIDFKENRTSAETACKAFNRCYYPGSGTGTIFRGDVMTDCRDKFNNWYNVGIQQTSRLQQVQNAQLGQDKFWNWSSAYAEEDSPFDLLFDLNVLAKVFFEDIKESFVIAYYKMPIFRGQGQDWDKGDKTSQNSASDGGTNSLESNAKGDGDNNTSSTSFSSGDAAEWRNWLGRDDEFTTFLDAQEGGQPSSFGDDQVSDIGKDPCAEDEDEDETDQDSSTTVSWWGDLSLDEVGVADFLQYVQDVLATEPQVDVLNTTKPTTATVGRIKATITYTPARTTTGTVDATISFNHADVVVTNNHGSTTYTFAENGTFLFEFQDKFWTAGSALAKVSSIRSPAEQENLEEAKKCIAKCDDLRIDEALACKITCTCNMRDSPLRNPETDPELWPILRIKYCAVPTTNHFFDANGIIVYSFEKIISEVYGVLDALDKSWELWTWTKQKEMLDSTTKNINFSDMFVFTVDSSVKSTNQDSSTSKEDSSDAQWLLTWQSIDANVVIQSPIAKVDNNVLAQTDYEWESQKAAELSSGWDSQYKEDQIEVLRNEKNINLWIVLDKFLLHHLTFWVSTFDNFKQMDAFLDLLASKKGNKGS